MQRLRQRSRDQNQEEEVEEKGKKEVPWETPVGSKALENFIPGFGGGQCADPKKCSLHVPNDEPSKK